MAIVTTTEVDGYAHCQQLVNGMLCKGNAQKPVRVIRETVTHSYIDGGGDLGPFPERSQIFVRWPDSGAPETRCEFCGYDGPMEISEQKRPVYPAYAAAARASETAGHMSDVLRGMALLQGNVESGDADPGALRAELDGLKAQLAAITSSPNAHVAPGANGAAASTEMDTPVAMDAGPINAGAAASPSPSRSRPKKES